MSSKAVRVTSIGPAHVNQLLIDEPRVWVWTWAVVRVLSQEALACRA
jgi:hypothetical protein